MTDLGYQHLLRLSVVLVACWLPLAAGVLPAVADKPPEAAETSEPAADPAAGSADDAPESAAPESAGDNQPSPQEPGSVPGNNEAVDDPEASQNEEELEGDEQVADDPEQILQDEPSFLVKVAVDRPDHRYREGESLRVTIASEEDAYAYVLYRQADGKVYQIFPNSAQPNNKVTARTEVTVPASDDQFRWRVSKPFGKELLKVIATKEPLEGLADPALREERFNLLADDKVRQAAKELKAAEPVAWAEDHVEITTYASEQSEAPPPGGKRYGVFFGLSEYEFNDVVEQFNRENDIKDSPKLNLPTPAPDARAAAAIMSSLGKLNALQVFVNEQATRRQMEAAITGWLPSVSRPGDTVFIFYSGHGGQIPDDNGDETDGVDECLLPHDFVGLAAFAGLIQQEKDGKLSPELSARYAYWLSIAKNAGSAEKAGPALVRATGVSDDLLGHWLQRLAGRRVVLVMDSCYSGGLATHEKGIESPPEKFDFLSGEIGRLKDIGQPDAVVFAASHKDQEASALRASDAMLAELRTGAKGAIKGAIDEWSSNAELSVFSYYFIEALLEGERPMGVDALDAHCRGGMAVYFTEVNEGLRRRGLKEATPHQPVLVNYSSTPIVVKP